jgi:hypothetical protein
MFHSFFQTNPTWKLSPNKRGIMSYQTSTVWVETKQKIDSTRTHLYVREAAGHFPGRYHRVLVQKQNSIPYHAQKEGIRKTFSCSLLSQQHEKFPKPTPVKPHTWILSDRSQYCLSKKEREYEPHSIWMPKRASYPKIIFSYPIFYHKQIKKLNQSFSHVVVQVQNRARHQEMQAIVNGWYACTIVQK